MSNRAISFVTADIAFSNSLNNSILYFTDESIVSLFIVTLGLITLKADVALDTALENRDDFVTGVSSLIGAGSDVLGWADRLAGIACGVSIEFMDCTLFLSLFNPPNILFAN
ncbi:Uncharacterised protein [Clostridioides difficile]|nr:Uncharacterised protein [Clostridioides difficile]